ncbi:MAG: polysaccharide biosynthesis C-terminal domain-containing protein [Tannerellaceae bacterium]|jgi:O-antigen/teichoic acid export membrane protein|nr:polysaccharide biosynthesis C-terminal domain-containing protein [Tannerellaceae bacterium]
MFKQILAVTGTRYAIAVLNLILIFVNARTLGAEGVGAVGLIWAAININLTVNSLLGGNSLVYFMPRYPLPMLLPVAMFWIVAGSTTGTVIMQLAGILPGGSAIHVGFLSVLYSAATANTRFLLGGNNLRGFNLVSILQGVILFVALLVIYFPMEHPTVGGYIAALYITHGIAAAASLVLLLPLLRTPLPAERPRLFGMVGNMLRYGMWSATDNVAENLATRLNYFLVEHFAGRGSVGLLDAATRIAESVWIISRSVAHIEYSRIARTCNVADQRRITVRVLRFTLVAVSLAMAAIVALPESLYAGKLFGEGFAGIRSVILTLSAGIIFFGGNTILSHYFIGSGNVRYAAFSSIIGLVAILVAAPLLIPAMGTMGAAIGSDIAFGSMFLFSLIIFRKKTLGKRGEGGGFNTAPPAGN